MLYSLKERYIEFSRKIAEWSSQNKKEQLDKEVIANLKDSRLFGFHSPIAFGGHGKDFIYHSVSIQELAISNPNLALSIINNFLCEQVILKFGSKSQQLQTITSLKSASKFAYMPLLDEDTFTKGSADYTFSKNALSFELTGKKSISKSLTNIDFLIVFARSIEDEELSAFLLSKDEFNVNGGKLEVTGPLDQSHLLGEMDSGLNIVKFALVQSHLSIASFQYALSSELYSKIVDSINQDESQVDFSLTKSLTTLSQDLEATKLLIYKACELRSNGISTVKRAAFAKKYAGDSLKLAIDIYNHLIDEKLNTNEKIYFKNIFSSDLEDINQIIFASILDNQKIQKMNIKEFEEQKIHRKQIIFDFNNNEINVNKLFEAIKDQLGKCPINQDIFAPIENSKICVSFGLGIGDRENIENIERFTRSICGVIACTLPIAEELEWLSKDRIVGISGKTFYGDLYFAIGLSGANQHIESIKNAKTVIAINSDKHAKIFSNCDYGIVGDANEILPILCQKIDFFNNGK